MNKKICSAVIALMMLAPSSIYAMEATTSSLGEEQFGECDPDVIYDTSYTAKTIVNGRLREFACMTGSRTLTIVPANGKVQVVAKTDGWYKVITTDGKTGWMGAKLLSKTSEKPVEIKKVINSDVFGQLVSLLSNLSIEQLNLLKEKIMARIGDAQNKPKETPVVNPNGKISLTGESHDGKVNLNWSIADVNVDQGFKVVVASHENPVYPGDDYHYITDPGARSDEWNATPGTYYFRVCQYLGGKCGTYSNNVKVVISGTESTSETSTGNSTGKITLSGGAVGHTVKLNWTLSGMTSRMGYKVVYSTSENPVYPGNDYHYYSEESTKTDEWQMDPGTYYFRACEYLGGKCGVYSNNLKVIVQ